jgi:hypothetical protein
MDGLPCDLDQPVMVLENMPPDERPHQAAVRISRLPQVKISGVNKW